MLPSDSTDDEILAYVRQFVNELAADNYEAAFRMLQQSEQFAHWTPSLAKEVISSYTLSPAVTNAVEGASHVTPIDEAVVDDVQPYADVNRYDADLDRRGNVVGSVQFDLPINGVWSDLTAIFQIRELDGKLVLELEDIHVL